MTVPQNSNQAQVMSLFFSLTYKKPLKPGACTPSMRYRATDPVLHWGFLHKWNLPLSIIQLLLKYSLSPLAAPWASCVAQKPPGKIVADTRVPSGAHRGLPSDCQSTVKLTTWSPLMKTQLKVFPISMDNISTALPGGTGTLQDSNPLHRGWALWMA